MLTDVLDDLYADDMDKNANSKANMQETMDKVSQTCGHFDLTISQNNESHQPAPYNEPTITVNGHKLIVVD